MCCEMVSRHPVCLRGADPSVRQHPVPPAAGPRSSYAGYRSPRRTMTRKEKWSPSSTRRKETRQTKPDPAEKSHASNKNFVAGSACAVVLCEKGVRTRGTPARGLCKPHRHFFARLRQISCGREAKIRCSCRRCVVVAALMLALFVFFFTPRGL